MPKTLVARRPPREQVTASILDAAILLFATRGYEATTMQDVAAKVGMTAPALYYYFDSKQRLLFDVIELNMKRFAGNVDAMLGSAPGSPTEELRSFVRTHLEFPARRGQGNTPVWSPDGKWVAFDAAREIYLSPTTAAAAGQKIEPNPNVPSPGRVRVGDWGGIFPHWRDAATLEFASGHRYVTYDVATGKAHAVEIRLRLPRPKPSGSMALLGAKIVTSDSAGVIEAGAIVVRGSRIACVGSCDTTGVDRVINVAGKTIIPGLIDVHAHHTDNEAGATVPQHHSPFALDLAYGVTTIVDPAASSASGFTLAELVDAGLMTGPRVYSTAETVIAWGSAWGDFPEIDSIGVARSEVNRRRAWGAVSIKNYRQPGRRQHQLLAQAAREAGISLTSEGGPLFLDVGYAIDGQTGWEHMIADLPLYKDATTFFAKAGLVYSPTLMVAGVPHGAMEYYRPSADLLNEARTRRFMPFPVLAAKVASAKPKRLEEMAFPIMAEEPRALICDHCC